MPVSHIKVPGLRSTRCSQFQFLVGADPGRQRVTAQIHGSLQPHWRSGLDFPLLCGLASAVVCIWDMDCQLWALFPFLSLFLTPSDASQILNEF